MSEVDKQGSIFQEMEERRSRCESLNAKAVEQGLVAASAMVSTDDPRVDEIEPELAPAFDMNQIDLENVSENEIRMDEISTAEDVLDTASDVDVNEIVIDNPPSNVSDYFDRLDDVENASEQLAEPEVAAEAEESPSYFGSLDEPMFEEPGPVLDEVESIAPAEPATETESIFEVSEPEEIAPVAEEEASLEDVSRSVEPEVAAEAEESPSYFGALDEPMFEEPGPVLDEVESIAPAEPAAEPESIFEVSEPEEIAPVVEEEVSLEDVSRSVEPEVAAETEESPSYFGSLDEPMFEEPGPVLDEVESIAPAEPAAETESIFEVSEPEEIAPVAEEEAEPIVSVSESQSELASEIEEEEKPEAVEDLIDESDEWLAPEPGLITDAEVRMAAEELVDRIGPVVDIQSLPKTQPSRVLSKTTKLKQAETPEAKTPTPSQELPKEPVVSKKEDDIVSKLVEDESSPKKKKKKKISLLDSYFKGL